MKLKFQLTFFFCMVAGAIFAQPATEPAARDYRYSFYAGVGPNLYFNNLVIAKDYVQEFNYSFAARFMWEPEHLLSLGIESGYYRLYAVDFGELSEVDIVNVAIPIQLVVCMKFMDHFYFNFSSGQTILLNKVYNAQEDNLNASTLSLGDFGGSLGYRHDWGKRFTWNIETKFFYSSKLDDKNLALLFLAGYKF